MDAGEWQKATEVEGGGDGKAGVSIHGGDGVRGGVTRAIRFKTPLHVRLEALRRYM